MKEIEIPNGYEARIEGNKVIIEKKESEDERIRKFIIGCIDELRKANAENAEFNGECSEALSYLEKQKEQNPAEWSEEFLRLMGITISQDGNQVCVLLGENLAEGIAGFGDTLADAVEEFKKEWRQFDRFHKATWKPSKEQMDHLAYAYTQLKLQKCYAPHVYESLGSLYDDLKKLI